MTEPFWIHFLGSKTIRVDEHHARVFAYGEQLEVTPAMVELNTDRLGNCDFDLVGEDDKQVARWGRVVMVDGPWPKELLPYEPGSVEEARARESARQTAWGLNDERERRVALAQLIRDFGPAPATSSNLYVVKDKA